MTSSFVSVDVKKFAGGQTFSVELLDRSSPAFFDELVRQSQINESENAQTVAELRVLQSDHGQGSSSRTKWKISRIAVIAAVVGLAVLAFVQKGVYFLSVVPDVGLLFVLAKRINPEISRLNAILGELNVKISEKTEEAEQLEAKQEVQPLPEIIPTEAPPPMSLKETAKQEVVLETQPPMQQKTAVARHPRNIPKFSKVRS
jgi:hypothetical protein